MGLTSLEQYNYHLQGGLRLNQFSVELAAPLGLTLDGEKFSALVSAASLPTMTVGVVEKKKRGRTIKLSGDSSPTGQWTVKLDLNGGKDPAMAITLAMKWQEISRLYKDPAMYKSAGQIQLYDTTGGKDPKSAIKAEIVGVWISTVTEVPLDDESVDEVGTYEITFEYDDVILTK